MNVIQCYSLTSYINEDDKDQFNEKLQSAQETTWPSWSETGTPKSEWTTPDWIGEGNENGEWSANLCLFNKMLIDVYIFPPQTHTQSYTGFIGSHCT